MNMEQEINTLLRKKIMDEIDGLAIKSTIREYVESEISKKDIVGKVDRVIDSYFRSALGKMDVELYIRNTLTSMIKSEVNNQINKTIGYYSSWSGNKKVEEAINQELLSTLRKGFDIELNVKAKRTKEE